MEKFPVSKLLLFTEQLLSTSCVVVIVNLKTIGINVPTSIY